MPLEPASISISIISLQLNMVVSLPNALHRRGAAGQVNGLGAAIYRHVLGPRLGPVHAKGEPRRIGGRSFEEANE
jgi:hypothetical protein